MLCPKTHKPPASDGFIPNSTIPWRNRISLYYRITLTRKEKKEGKKEGERKKGRKRENQRKEVKTKRKQQQTTRCMGNKGRGPSDL